MTKPKVISRTLKSTIGNPVVKSIQDRSVDIDPIIEKVKGFWSFDLFSRKPGAAYDEDGTFKGTDLDLAVVLYTLAARKAVVHIPEYKSTRQTKVKEGQMLSSKKDRHGNLTQVIANKDSFAFSIRIKDMNVMSTDEVGDFRSFSITKFDGGWNPNWSSIRFMPSGEEKKFIVDSGILSENKIEFKNFVHPNRWTSMYGQYYFMTKLLIKRVEEESKHYFSEIKRMKAEGIEYPETEAPKVWPKTEAKSDKKSIKITAFQAEIDFPDNDSIYNKRRQSG